MTIYKVMGDNMYSFEEIEKENKKLNGKHPIEIIKWAVSLFNNKIAFSSSLSIEDQVLTDIIAKNFKGLEIFTLDTGRLPKQTYDLIEKTRQKYDMDINILFPERKEVEAMVNKDGPNLFYDSYDNRKKCCRIRKIEPLKRKLKDLNAWITGLRKEQSVTRKDLQIVEIDKTFNLIKVNPLAYWNEKMVSDYIKKNDVPYNNLYNIGYKSIGCEPCSRAIKDGEDVRAGRWWWEDPEKKECGLHIKDKKSKREI